MKRRLLIVGITCGVLAGSGAAAVARQYALVADGWGIQDYCTGDYAHETASVVPFAGGRAALAGLDRFLVDEAVPVDRGTGLQWVRGRSLYYGDLRTGRVRLLATARNLFPYPYAVAPRGRAAIMTDGDAHVIVAARSGARTVRHRYAGSGGVGLSFDGRYASYSDRTGVQVLVRPAARGAPRVIAAEQVYWSPVADRFAYLHAASLQVVDAGTGAPLADVPLPDTAVGDTPTWSPDGRYVAFSDGTVVDVATGRLVGAALSAYEIAWRPRHGHQLLASESRATSLEDVARGVVLWRHNISDLVWSADGGWLLEPDFAVRSSAGLPVRSGSLQAAFDQGTHSYWAGDHTMVFSGRRLRIARPPSWRVRTFQLGRAGHDLDIVDEIDPTRAGLALVRREFARRAAARDC